MNEQEICWGQFESESDLAQLKDAANGLVQANLASFPQTLFAPAGVWLIEASSRSFSILNKAEKTIDLGHWATL